jgi:hypothetical protein
MSKPYYHDHTGGHEMPEAADLAAAHEDQIRAWKKLAQTCPSTTARSCNDLTQWDHLDVYYAPGYLVGSEDEDGTHRQDETGWPYSIYRKAGAVGYSDHVLCHGIQNLGDAYTLAQMLNARLGIDRYR